MSQDLSLEANPIRPEPPVAPVPPMNDQQRLPPPAIPLEANPIRPEPPVGPVPPMQVVPQMPAGIQAVPQYQELHTTSTPTPTPTCRPCRNRGMMILLAIVLLAAIIYLILYGDELFSSKKSA